MAYTGKNLSTCFNVKDQGEFGHQHEIADRPNEHGCRISERIKDHNGRYLKSRILKHSVESRHVNVNYYDFKIIAKNFSNNSW